MNINERMAKVMGWRSDGNAWVLRWIENGFEVEDMLMKSDWRPDTDIAQARDCLEKHLNNTNSTATMVYNLAGVWQVSIDYGFGEDKFLEKAICEAILDALEVDNE